MLERMLKEKDIPGHFDCASLHFRLAKFQKGELLTAPFKTMNELLFLMQGKVNIYGLREDGSSFSVYLADQDILLGDIEFIRKAPLPFYTEALEEVVCIALSTESYRKSLESDLRFTNFLLHSVADKFFMFLQTGSHSQPVEDRLVAFLRNIQPDHILHGMNAGVMQLHCSRSQLQRVVRTLCDEGILEKLGKGQYRLI